MNTQPEALRLADKLLSDIRTGWIDPNHAISAAYELRRLSDVNQELVEALERLTSAANDVDDGYLTDAINQAEAALAKQQEKRNEYTTRARK